MSYRQKPKTETKLAYTPRIEQIIKLYDKANLEYIPTYDDQKEMEFYDALSRNTDKSRHHVFISTLYRVKTDKKFSNTKNFDEALVYYMSQELETTSGMVLRDERRHEYFWNPVTRPTRNAEGQSLRFDIKYTEPYFTMPFTPKNVDLLMEKSDTLINSFNVALASRTGPNEFQGNPLTIWNLDDFKYGTWQELVDMNTYRFTKQESSLDEWRREGPGIKKANRNIVSTVNTGPSTIVQQQQPYNQQHQKDT
jgi:hypothetical protein